MPDGQTQYTIMIVEDNPGDVMLIREYLSEVNDFQAHCTHAGTIADALALMQDTMPDVILLDLGLPDAYGLDGLEKLKAYNDTAPIVILTANAEPAMSLQALDLGAQDYLMKNDINAQSLSLAIRYALERQQYIQQLLHSTHEKYSLLLQVATERFMRQTVTNIQHEFRTPITVIRTGVELIQRHPSASMIDKKSQTIMQATNRLLILSEYMATITRLSSVHAEDAPLLQAAQVASLCRDLAAGYGRVQTTTEDDFIIQMSPDDLTHILRTLIDNALTYSPEDAPIHIILRQSNMNAEVMVQDAGIGIAEEHFEDIFLPFFRLDESRTHADDGDAGLGLSLAQATAMAYGGRVVVESVLNEGSTFTLALPNRHGATNHIARG